jgi:hypothetical protein
MTAATARLRVWLLFCGVLLLCGSAFGLWWWYGQTPEVTTPRPLAIVVSGDTSGWIVPCGCASNQAGGLMRRGTFLARVQHEADTLYVDAGGAPGGTAPYHRLKFEAILQGEMAMSVAAHNLGGPEAALGAEYLREVRSKLRVPFISANVRDAKGDLVVEPLRVETRGKKRIAITGVLSRKYATENIRIDEPKDAILAAKAKAGAYDTLVVLAYLPEEELRQLAKELPEVDLLLGGPTVQSISPQQVGPTLLAAATNKGKYVLHLELLPGTGQRWHGKVVELGPQFSDEPKQRENLHQYLTALERRDFTAAESGFAPATSTHYAADFRIAGNEECLKCHQGDCQHWHQTKHSHAWQTLTDKGYHVDSYCQQCHTTGYGLPGGFVSRRESMQRHAVGCESCHGPSLTHVRDVKQRTPFVAKDQCQRCHDPENSPTFDYATYWERIRHGQSPGKSSAK